MVDVALRSGVVEHLMRVCGDDAAVLKAATATTLRSLQASVGELLSTHAVGLVIGTPLMTLAGFGEISQTWHAACPARTDSLWSQLEFYRTCGWTATADNPLDELLDARDRAEAAIA